MIMNLKWDITSFRLVYVLNSLVLPGKYEKSWFYDICQIRTPERFVFGSSLWMEYSIEILNDILFD